jgi:hypothetical protein
MFLTVARPRLLSHTDYMNWIRSLMRPVATAFLVIDMQNCFLTGSLSLKDAPARQGRDSPMFKNYS